MELQGALSTFVGDAEGFSVGLAFGVGVGVGEGFAGSTGGGAFASVTSTVVRWTTSVPALID